MRRTSPYSGQYGSSLDFCPISSPRKLSDMIDAEITMTGNLLLKEGALARRQKEYIFLVCSAANLSTYCVTAHCEMVRMLRIEGPEPEQIALDHTATNLPMALKALLNFAAKLNRQAA